MFEHFVRLALEGLTIFTRTLHHRTSDRVHRVYRVLYTRFEVDSYRLGKRSIQKVFVVFAELKAYVSKPNLGYCLQILFLLGFLMISGEIKVNKFA